MLSSNRNVKSVLPNIARFPANCAAVFEMVVYCYCELRLTFSIILPPDITEAFLATVACLILPASDAPPKFETSSRSLRYIDEFLLGLGGSWKGEPSATGEIGEFPLSAKGSWGSRRERIDGLGCNRPAAPYGGGAVPAVAVDADLFKEVTAGAAAAAGGARAITEAILG